MTRSNWSAKIIGLAVAGMIASSSLFAAPSKSCTDAHCAAGDKAVTYGPKTDPFMICPTRELSDYMAFEYGMLSMSAALTGKMPNISDKTGDIDFKDGPEGPNTTRLMQDYYRGKSGASTFDEAMSKCAKGQGGRPVTILNWPDEHGLSMSAWVRDERANISYWIPRGSLNKR